jgi:hypothetical protein
MKTTDEASKTLEMIENHPLTRKLKEEQAAELLARREKAAERIATLNRERDETLPPLREALAEAEAAHRAAADAAKRAEATHREAKLRQLQESWRFENEIKALSAELSETAPPEITAAIDYFRDRLDWLREPGRIRNEREGVVKNLFLWNKKSTVATNAAAVTEALQYCQQAILTLERMKLAPAADLDAIEALKAGLPTADRFEAEEVERNLPKGPDLESPLQKIKRAMAF